MLTLFVYGSLKRGQQNFDRYCSGYRQALAASVVGRLYRQADGYPMLVVPAENIQAVGTVDGLADTELLGHQNDSSPCGEPTLPTGDWQWITGDLLQYEDDWSQRLRRLDRLEDFYPDQASLYYRAIIAARTEQGPCWVWAYVAPAGVLPTGATRMGTSWP